jgi:uncharacterized protein (TIGR03086 family)
MESIAERYRRHADAFERTIAGVRPDQWSCPSPCAAWTARDVVGHVVDMHGQMLVPVGRRLDPSVSVTDDPAAAFRAARTAVEAVLAEPELAATECRTPAGPMSAEDHIDQVVSDDLVVHGWDLARASGQDGALHPDDVARLWAIGTAVPAELMERFRTPGAFGPGIEVYGPEVPVDEAAPLQDRLLGFLGRDPAWTP